MWIRPSVVFKTGSASFLFSRRAFLWRALARQCATSSEPCGFFFLVAGLGGGDCFCVAKVARQLLFLVVAFGAFLLESDANSRGVESQLLVFDTFTFDDGERSDGFVLALAVWDKYSALYLAFAAFSARLADVFFCAKAFALPFFFVPLRPGNNPANALIQNHSFDSVAC